MTVRHLAIMAALLAAAILPVHAEAPFYFVQITDTHFGSRGHDQIAAQMVETINSLPMPIACVIHTGDIIADRLDNPGVLAVATGTLARLKAPLHLTPGNHDILKKRVESTLSVYTNSIGPLAERVDYPDVTFLMVHTEPLDAAAPIDGFDPLDWLEKALAETGDRPVIVCHHRPPVDDFHGGRMHPGWPEATRERWIRLLNRGNVIAVLAGHFHRDELHWLGDVPLFVSAPMAIYWGRQPSFRLYEYRDGRLGYRTIYLEGKEVKEVMEGKEGKGE
jgi:3',5'-cyclic AMP phosphodiesterase CpdA